MKPSLSKHGVMDPTTTDEDLDRPVDDAPLTPEERTRDLAEPGFTLRLGRIGSGTSKVIGSSIGCAPPHRR